MRLATAIRPAKHTHDQQHLWVRRKRPLTAARMAEHMLILNGHRFGYRRWHSTFRI
jgi:hypothetical protein